MDNFIDALLSGKTAKIPDEYDWFAPLIGKVLDQEDTYWIFSDITGNSFKWENVMIRKDGTRILDCEIHGKRLK